MNRSPIFAIIVLSTIALQCCTTGDDKGCNSSPHSTEVRVVSAQIPDSTHENKANYSVYLENSLSVNGYLNVSGDGSFKDVVYSLITSINGFPDKKSLNLYDINTEIIPVSRNANAVDVNAYITNLDAETFRKRSKKKGGKQSKSDLAGVFKMVLDSTGSNTVSILISDCIFSPDKGNALDYLSQQKAAIQGYFQNTKLSTLVLKFQSDFDGAYYYQDNFPKNSLFKDRPYYMTCIGPEEALRKLYDYVDAKFKAKAFKDFLFLTPNRNFQVNPMVVINNQYYDYEPDCPLIITSPKKGEDDNIFKIQLLVDYSELPLSENYLVDTANYNLSSGYRIESIKPIKLANSSATHEIVLVSGTIKPRLVNVSLNCHLPHWVDSTNIDADKGKSPDELKGKTFGIQYLLGGMFDAYYPPNPKYFSFSIQVKN
ncbi:MAG: hypothetical protein ABI378_01050 [Chitinophagaceae bacterium]